MNSNVLHITPKKRVRSAEYYAKNNEGNKARYYAEKAADPEGHKVCRAKRDAEWRERAKKADTDLDKKRYRKARARLEAKGLFHEYTRDVNYKTKYGLTLLQVLEKLENQMGLCANRGCGREIDVGDKVPAKLKACVDHCHTTGKIRGILCVKCNAALGLLEESKNSIGGLIEYLHKHG